MSPHTSSSLRAQPTSDSSSTKCSKDPRTSSTLRSRLLSREPSQVKAPAERPAYPDIYQQVNTYFEKSCNKGGEITPSGASPKDNDAITKLRETFARAGDKLHKSALTQLNQAHAEIQDKIDAFDQESSAILVQYENLYSQLAYPLSSTVVRCSKFPKTNLKSHLSTLKEEVNSTIQQLQRLGDEWNTCDQAELAAWEQLVSQTTPLKRVNRNVDAETEKMMATLKEEAQDIADSQCTRIAAIAQDFKAKIKEQREIIIRAYMSDDDE